MRVHVTRACVFGMPSQNDYSVASSVSNKMSELVNKYVRALSLYLSAYYIYAYIMICFAEQLCVFCTYAARIAFPSGALGVSRLTIISTLGLLSDALASVACIVLHAPIMLRCCMPQHLLCLLQHDITRSHCD
jgi:hypothetical protein